eukprot:1229629-Rhodomonas_salina.2
MTFVRLPYALAVRSLPYFPTRLLERALVLATRSPVLATRSPVLTCVCCCQAEAEAKGGKGGCDVEIKAVAKGKVSTPTPQNPVQETTISVHFVPGMRFLVFYFGVSADDGAMRCLVLVEQMAARFGL